MSDQKPTPSTQDTWAVGDIYERYVGRWSRPVARDFLHWLHVPSESRWLDVGCGTGALSQTILENTQPTDIKGVDLSAAFVAFARDHVVDERVCFEVANAQDLPFENSVFDAVVSGLVLNFIPDQSKVLHEMARVAKPGGVVAVYIWDYADQMQMMRFFWDAVTALHPEASALDEGPRFPICHPDPLKDLFEGVGLERIEVRSIDSVTHFQDFDDYWTPFLGGQGPAPSYVASLNDHQRAELREALRNRLPINADGSIGLNARAWAGRGYIAR